MTRNTRGNRIDIYVGRQSDPVIYSFSISNKNDYDSLVSKLEKLLANARAAKDRVKQDAKDLDDYNIYEATTNDNPKDIFEDWMKKKDEENNKMLKNYQQGHGGRKTRKRKRRASTKKHKKNKKHKKRASTKNHKKYKKKRKSTRKR